jgi:hypothetical protein
MNCLECQELLQKRLDGQKVASAALDQHVSECATCKDQHAAALRLLDGLKQLPSPTLPADFARSMTSQVMHDRRQRQVKMRRRLVLTVLLAASVLLMLLIAYSWMPQTQPVVPGKDSVVQKAPPRNEPAPKGVPEEKQAKTREPRHPLTAMTDRVADTTRDHAKVVLAAANFDAVEKLPVKDLDPGMREAGQEVTDGVRLVTRNTQRAFDFFARELPMPDTAAKTD